MRSSKTIKIFDDKEITDKTHILECIREFYETLFKKRKQKTAEDIKFFLGFSLFQNSLNINQNFVRKY